MRERLQNTFSWSFSRHQCFEECPRKYWYTYYGSWEGWPLFPGDPRKSVDPLAAYLYAVKQMQHFPMFVGSVVHKVIETALKSGRPFSLDQLIKDGEKCLLKGIDEAEKEAWRKSPKRHAHLFETYYGRRGGAEPFSTDAIEEGKNKVRRCLTHWFESPIVQKLILDPKCQTLSIEELDTFSLDGKYKIYVVIDLAVKWGKSIVLFDWKTGKETDKTLAQLYSYVLYGEVKWGVGPFVITPFYLDHNKYDKIQDIDAGKLKDIQAFIRASCEKMTELLRGKGEVPLKSCGYTDKRYLCRRCTFKELCTASDYSVDEEDALREICQTKLYR